jgi:transaldolase/glucose-6-phosphate isomerase
MAMNALQAVFPLGQSLWLDFIRRDLLEGGELARLIREDGIRGLTSNPAIFEKAIGGSRLYDAQLAAAVAAGVSDPEALYEQLAVEDIRRAADAFAALYRDSGRRDGFVSLEVAPRHAHDADTTVAEALRLAAAVDRPNLMIKVPGTPAGVQALPRLIGRGLSINVTLLFDRAAYRAIAEAYLDGLEQWRAGGGDPAQVASVASFFVSRIDSAADPQLPPALQGKVAIANAQAAYADYQALLATPRWQALAAWGARPQRLLWASTGTKNPAYPATHYVDALIGPDTVNTLPPATLEAYRQSGRPERRLDRDPDAARRLLAEAAAAGLDLDAITAQLCSDGIAQFEAAFAQLLAAVAAKRDQLATA